MKAREIIDRTLYSGETVLAFSAATDVGTPAVTFVDSSPNFWIAVTQSRFITVGEASGQATSHLLPEIKVLEVHRKLLGGSLLHFDPAGLGPDLGLMTLKVHDKATAKALPALLSDRAHAPVLPKETTSYTSVTVKSPAYLVPFVGEESEDLLCTTCGGICGVSMKGEATVYPECSACNRSVIKPDAPEA
ncbi:hypothetical protein ABT124_17865 [Streptomyces sp. NPDC001982]|uniref:hypothetical protein n=1 Tax=Streptomyces sp. NPDC001982 TaxID=3154405 RepID=UPI00331DFFF2